MLLELLPVARYGRNEIAMIDGNQQKSDHATENDL